MESKTTAIRAIKQEVRLQEWSAQIEAQQAKTEAIQIFTELFSPAELNHSHLQHHLLRQTQINRIDPTVFTQISGFPASKLRIWQGKQPFLQ